MPSRAAAASSWRDADRDSGKLELESWSLLVIKGTGPPEGGPYVERSPKGGPLVRRELDVGATFRWPVRNQNIPSCSFAASDIRSRSQGGSHTTSTFTSVTPGTAATARFTCSGRNCAAGHAGAVSVMRMPTAADCIDDDVVDQPQLVDVDRISGSNTVESASTIRGMSAALFAGIIDHAGSLQAARLLVPERRQDG